MSRELIKKAKAGDPAALNELIDRHKDLAYSVALKYLGNKQDAEDIAQNSFLIVLKSIGNFRSEAKFSTWLYKIVYHECLRVLRQQKRTTYLPEFLEIPAEETEEEINPSAEVQRLMSSLKPLEFTIVSLFYLKEKSIKEIAAITSQSKTNIKVVLHRARKKMKEEALTQNA